MRPRIVQIQNRHLPGDSRLEPEVALVSDIQAGRRCASCRKSIPVRDQIGRASVCGACSGTDLPTPVAPAGGPDGA